MNKLKSRVFLLASSAVLLAAASCVELARQRISIFHDEARDRLQVLIHHDGIHEFKPGDGADGLKQIPEYVARGSVMLLDWPLHIDMGEVRRAAADENTAPAQRAFARALAASVTSHPLGHYRDAQGRIGAAQLVEVSGVKDFLGKANAALSEVFLREESWELSPRTLEKLKRAAAEGRQWIALEGHSLRFTFPVHPREWARNKARCFAALAEEAEEAEKKQEPGARGLRRGALSQLFALSPISLTETAGEVSIRLGDPGKPSTYRFNLRDRYTTRLEETIIREIPRPLDLAIADRLLEGPAEKADPRIEALLAWGPKEEAVRALVAYAEDALSAGAARAPDRKRAVERLRAWGESWDREHGVPAAPGSGADEAAYLKAWKDWYVSMLEFPLQP